MSAKFTAPSGIDPNRYIAREQEIKKILKKVKEIEKLKQKNILNTEETEKVSKLQEYMDILYPQQHKSESKIDEERKRKQNERHDEKLRKKEEERRTRAKKILEEEMKRNKRRQEETRNTENKKPRVVNIEPKEIDNVEFEFIQEMVNEQSNPVRAFRKLSLKYHPDRNIDRKEWAENKQKLLLELREKYMNI